MFINCLTACLPCFWMCCSLNLQCLFLGLTKQAVDSLPSLCQSCLKKILPQLDIEPRWVLNKYTQVSVSCRLFDSFLLGTMLVRKLKTHTPNKKRKLKTTQCPFVCSFVTVETYQFCFSFEHTNCLCQGLRPKLSSYTAAWHYPSRGWLFEKRKFCSCDQCSS